MNKSELRKSYLERRRAIPASEHARLSGEIIARLFSIIHFGMLRSVHCYVSMDHLGEVETANLFKRMWEVHPVLETSAPRVDSTSGEIESIAHGRDTPVVTSGWGIQEPAGAGRVAPETLDLVIVPLLCFDASGHRVGYGKGYYDRFLQKCRPDCIKAGLSFFPPVEKIDDIHVADVQLDLVVTPNETFYFK